MSEDRSNQTAPSDGPACEGESLIIEVLGKKDAQGQAFRIYDETNWEQQSSLESQGNSEDLGDRTLHVWPWKGQPRRNVWLDIEASEGAPIRVPLFRDVASSPRQFNGQWNRIWPVVPLTLMNDPNPEPGQDPDNIMPVRPGFVYIFRKDTLWREVEVRNSDAGTLEFCDVRLTDYRDPGMPGVNSDQRTVVGKPLTSIWLPVCQMNTAIMDEFQLAFSQVQFSAEQLAHLELNESARQKRCQTLRGPEPIIAPQCSPQPQIAPGKLMSLASLPAMRLREPELEKRLLRPWKQVYDLSGTYASDLFSQAKEEVQAFDAGGDSAEDAWASAFRRDCPLRGAPSARVDAFLAESESDGANIELWQALSNTEDALVLAKENYYAGVILEDCLFPIWHRLTAGQEARRFLDSLLEAIEQKPHGDSAQLVYRLMGPERLGGQENGLHRYLEEIDTSLFSHLHTNLSTAQRQLAREELAEAQDQLAKLLRQADNQTAMADLFNLTGADYIEGFACTADLFQVLATDPNKVDHLARVAVANDFQIRDANNLVLSIVEEGSVEPLHCMLFPPEQAEARDSSGGSAISRARGECGDGRCRPEDLEQLPNQKPDPSAIQTLTAAALVGISNNGDVDLSSQYKRWLAGTGAILDGIDKNVRSLISRLKSQTYSLDSRLYGPLLRMAKARDPSLLGSVQLVARNAVPQDWVILGLRDPASGLEMGLTKADREYSHKANGHRKFYGEYLDVEGKPLASTRKSSLPDLADTAEARRFHVYAAPESSDVVRAQRSLRGLARLDEVLDHVRVPYLVFMFEGHNVWSEFSLLENIAAQKGRTRAGFGATSAALDLLYAGAIAVERLSKDVAIWANLSSKLGDKAFQTTNPVFQRALPSLARAIPEIITKRLLGGLITAGLTITVTLLDMAHEWDTGDLDAAAAYGATAIGGGMMVMGGLMMTKMAEAGIAPILLGLGPWGWVLTGVAVTIGASMLAAILDDPPLVDWLKRGPFGSEQDNSYPHLAESPEETYYRLVNLLAKPRITIKKVNNMHAKLAEQGYLIDSWRAREIENVNTMVRVENNLAVMLDSTTLAVAMRPMRITRRSSSRGPQIQREILQQAPEIILEQPLPNGKAFYMALPQKEVVEKIWSGKVETTSQLRVKAQWQAGRDSGEACGSVFFPSPKLHDATTFNLAEHGEPDFSKIGQLFWADEQTHRSEEAT